MNVTDTSRAVYHSQKASGAFSSLESVIFHVMKCAKAELTAQEIRHLIKDEFKILKPSSTVSSRLTDMMTAGHVTNTGPRRRDQYSKNMKQTWKIGEPPDRVLTALGRTLRRLRGVSQWMRDEMLQLDPNSEPSLHLMRARSDIAEMITAMEAADAAHP